MKNVKEKLKEVLEEPYNPDEPFELMAQMLNIVTMTTVIIAAAGAAFLVSKGAKLFKKSQNKDA